ncbi:MAG: hypothetical protein ACO3QP_07885, partial [Burkholderiaceae bacterium]
DKSWTDYGVASYHAKQYTYKTAARRAKANLGVARASLTAQMRPLESRLQFLACVHCHLVG